MNFLSFSMYESMVVAGLFFTVAKELASFLSSFSFLRKIMYLSYVFYDSSEDLYLVRPYYCKYTTRIIMAEDL